MPPPGVIGVRATVTEHVGRLPTRSERQAAYRAARTLANRGGAQTIHAQVFIDGCRRRVLLLARPDVDVTDSELLARVAAYRPRIRPVVPAHRGAGPDVAQRLDALVGRLTRAAFTASRIDGEALDPEHAAVLAVELSAALGPLVDLRARLRHRAHLPPAAPSNSAQDEGDVR